MAESKLRTLSIDFAVQILNLVKALKSGVWCVLDGFLHFLWNILYLLVEIHGLSVYSIG